jgi:hypothetical protein
MGKNVAAPTVFDGRPQVPFPTYAILETVEKDHVMTPGQFCSKLQDLRVGPRLGEGTHVAKIAEAETLHPGKLRAEILGQPIHDLSSPPLGHKAGGEVLSDRPVEPDGLLVEGQGGP